MKIIDRIVPNRSAAHRAPEVAIAAPAMIAGTRQPGRLPRDAVLAAREKILAMGRA